MHDDLKITLMGTPSLYQKSLFVQQFNSDLQRLVDTLYAAMYKFNGVGIAAPQIGINKRVIVFGFEKNPRYPGEESVSPTTLVNPEYEVLSEKLISGWEGCLSVPKIRGLVDRYEKIRYWGYNEKGELIKRDAEGFHARVVQHEVDHLDGILFPSRVRDLRNLCFEATMAEYSQE